jgi:polysaccharide biosynthesis transport protein
MNMTQRRSVNPSTGHLSDGHSLPLLMPVNSQPAVMRNVTEVENGFATLLRRHRRAVISLFIFFVVAACLYTQLAPKSYKVQTVLELRGLNQDFMNGRDVSPTGSQIIDPTYIDTQVRLMQNNAVTARVVQAMQQSVPANLGASSAAKEDVVRRILGSMKVKEEGSSNLVSISLLGPDPQLSAGTANQLVQQYIEGEQDARLSEATQTDTFLQHQLDQAKDKLQGAEDALQAYAHDSGIVLTSDSQEPVASEHLREIQQGLAQAQVDLADRQAELDVARNSTGESLPEVVDDPVIRADKDKLRDLRVQLADLSTTMTPANYKVMQIQAQIQDLEQEMALHRNIIVERITAQQHEASRRTALLQSQYQQQLATAMDQGSKQVHYNMLRNEVDIDQQIYQGMVQKVKEAGVLAALRTPNARVVSAAIAPTMPYSPNLAVSLALGILLASISSLLYIVIAERRNRSLRAPGETEVFLPNAELAAIPHAQLRVRHLRSGSLHLAKPLDQKHHPMLAHWSKHDGTILSEAFRMAGTSILLRTEGGTHSKILLITSPHPQCGKTMSTSNLAISLAEGSKKVVVVDGDLRKSGLSHLFGFDRCQGLSDILSKSGEDDPLKLIRPTDFPGVSILPSGTVSDNAAKLLQSDRLHDVLELIRAQYDFVLLDGPPLLGLADARLLGKRADGIILVCRAGRTQGDELNEAWSLLRDDGANILGTILNGYDLRTERPSRYSNYLGYTRRIS